MCEGGSEVKNNNVRNNTKQSKTIGKNSWLVIFRTNSNQKVSKYINGGVL